MTMIRDMLAARALKNELAKRRTKLYRVAYSWCHSPALSDDLVQETMLKAIKNVSSLKDKATLDTWLYRILSNNWHDYLRQQGRHTELFDMCDEDQQTYDDAYQQSQIVARVRAAVSKLPLALREIISLADFANFSYAEIAEILDIPIGTVMSRLYRARQALTEDLLDFKGEHPIPMRLTRVK